MYVGLNFEIILDFIVQQSTTLWRVRSALEKCLLIVCGTLLLMVVILAIIISSKNGWDDAQILHVTSHKGNKSHELITKA